MKEWADTGLLLSLLLIIAHVYPLCVNPYNLLIRFSYPRDSNYHLPASIQI